MIPILVTVYNRIEHFKKCIESLVNCENSGNYVLIIAHDRPKYDLRENNFFRIKDYVNSIRGFSNIVYLERKVNLGSMNNYLSAVKEVLSEYESMIFLEDDNVVHPQFLNYMNFNLDKYKNDDKVVGISGFNYNLGWGKETSNLSNFYYSKFASAFGMGIWRNKYKIPKYSYDELEFILLNKAYKEKLGELNLWSERHIYEIRKAIFTKNNRWGDFCMVVRNVIEDKFFIFPTETFVKNIGADGTGVHQKTINRELFEKQNFIKLDQDWVQSIQPLNNFFNVKKDLRKYFRLTIKARIMFQFLKIFQSINNK